jgi:hypothetical protein
VLNLLIQKGENMTEQNVEVETVTNTEEDEGPVYYNPNRVSLVAGIASVLSWFVLVGFLADVVTQFLNVNSTVTAQGMTFVSLFKEPAALSFLVTNLLTPFFTGLTLFILLQAASLGLNVVLETDFNARDNASK